MFTKGSTAIERSSQRGSRRWRWRGSRSRLACALVVPERPAAEQQEQREDRKLGCSRAADHGRRGTTPGPARSQPDDEREHCDLPYLLGPVERLADVLEPLQESPGGGDVYNSPLGDLAAAQPGPGALGSRSVGVSVTRRPPWRRSVAAYPWVRAGNRSTGPEGRHPCWFSTNSAHMRAVKGERPRPDRRHGRMDILDLLEPGRDSMIHLHAREEVGVVDHDAIFIHGKVGLEAAAIEVLE